MADWFLDDKNSIQTPVVPTGNKIEIPKLPRGMSPDYMTVSDNEFIPSKVSGDLINTNEHTNNVAISNPLFNKNGFLEIKDGLDLNTGIQPSFSGQMIPRFGSFDDNIDESKPNSMPDFATTSDQERRMGLSSEVYEIPDTYSLINQNAVSPTVSFEENSDYGKVRIVPPQDNLSSNTVTPMFNLNNKGTSGGIPTTDSGVPLISIVD